MNTSDRRRFYSKMAWAMTGNCLEWTAQRDKDGYGKFKLDGRSQRAHRLAYIEMRGPIPEGLELDHLCRNPPCVNPSHLEPVTTAENVRRGWAARGLKTHCVHGHEFTEANTIRQRSGKRQCRECHHIHNRRNWKGGVANGDKTHCPQGHEYTEENTYWRTNGGRQCRKCTRIHAGWQGKADNKDKTHCLHGHEFTEENTISRAGKRKCRECDRAISLRYYHRKKREREIALN